MKARHRTSADWAIGVGGFAVAAAGIMAGVGIGHAQPPPVDPVIPHIPGVVTGIVTANGPLPVSPPPPPEAPTVPPVRADQLQQPGALGSIGDIMTNFSNPNYIMTDLLPYPSAPYTPVRQMPTGPPPPPDPAFAPPG